MKVWYNITNGGDGSAIISWFESEELANWDEKHQSEPFAEGNVGYIEGDNIIEPAVEYIQTKCRWYLRELLEPSVSNPIEDFKTEFFPDGLPQFSIQILNEKQYGIYLKDDPSKCIYKEYGEYDEKKRTFIPSEEGRQKLEQQINEGKSTTY